MLTPWEPVGTVTMSNGMCFIGDPNTKARIKDWKAYKKMLGVARQTTVQFNSMPGRNRAVIIITGEEDKEYPVEVRRDEKTAQIVEVRITFDSEAKKG